ncbi:MAG TPA: NADP-dependent oxidoreductase [Acidimicrobiales bacterium]
MKAVRIHEPGGPEGLVYEDTPDPTPTAGDVVVEVHACGFTPDELRWPATWVDRAGRPRTPSVPAHEVSGVVVAVGAGTTGFAVGDEVFGLGDPYRDGAAAEYVAIEARNLAPKPATIDHAAAAALPQAGLAAWQGLFVHGWLNAGQALLVHGAAGGVGSMAVQLGAECGAKVIGTGRPGARATVMDLGAVRFVDLEKEPFEQGIRRVDVAFDTIGGDVLARTGQVVRDGGALVSIAGVPPEGSVGEEVRSTYFVRVPDRGQLEEIARRVDAGGLRPTVGAVYPLAEAREAFLTKAASSIPGKVVLTVR